VRQREHVGVGRLLEAFLVREVALSLPVVNATVARG
jgi:hypothetical protein